MTYCVSRGKYHSIARCSECNWIEQDYRVAEEKAVKHVLSTGHQVSLDTGEILDRTTVDEVLKGGR